MEEGIRNDFFHDNVCNRASLVLKLSEVNNVKPLPVTLDWRTWNKSG